MDRRPAAAAAGQWGSCPTQALAAEAELATRMNFQFSAPVLGPGRRPGSRAFMGSFPSREEQATAVNSLIPIACPLQAWMVQTPLLPRTIPTHVLEALAPPAPEGARDRLPRAPTALLQFPTKLGQRARACPVLSPGSGSEGQGGCSGASTPAFLVWFHPATARLGIPRARGH